MKLTICLEFVHVHCDPATTDVRFWEYPEYLKVPVCCRTMNMKELYNDWYGECNNCPENGQYIFGIEFVNHEGKTFLVDNSEITFEELMGGIEKTYNLNHPEK